MNKMYYYELKEIELTLFLKNKVTFYAFKNNILYRRE